jgi:hypothetical protein
MTVCIRRPDDEDRPMQVPEVIHDLRQANIGQRVESEDGVYCPHCGRFQIYHLTSEPMKTCCEVCGHTFWWMRRVFIHYVASTIPFEQIPE